MKRIIYQNNQGGISIVSPAPEAVLEFGIEEIARKDVPAGVPYVIVNTSDLPPDYIFRDAWEVEITKPDGVGYGSDRWFADRERERLIAEEAARHQAELAAQAAAIQESIE